MEGHEQENAKRGSVEGRKSSMGKTQGGDVKKPGLFSAPAL